MRYCLLLVLAACGCSGKGSVVSTARPNADLVVASEGGRIVRRVPVAGAVVGTWRVESAGKTFFVAVTGRELRRGGADVGKILLFDEAGTRLWEHQVPRDGGFVDATGQPLAQVNASAGSMCGTAQVDGRDWFLFASTGTWHPRWFGAFELQAGTGGTARLEPRVSLWHGGHLSGSRVLAGRSLYMAGYNNSYPRKPANNLAVCVFRMDLPGAQDAPVEARSPDLSQPGAAAGKGFAWYSVIAPLRPSVEPAGRSANILGLASERTGIRLDLAPPGLEERVSFRFDQEGRLLVIEPSRELRDEYEAKRTAGEVPLSEWLGQIRDRVVLLPK